LGYVYGAVLAGRYPQKREVQVASTSTNTRDVTIQGQRFQVECTGAGQNLEIHIRSQTKSGTQPEMATMVRNWAEHINTQGGQKHQAKFQERGGDYVITVNNVPQGEFTQYLDQLENYLATNRAAGATATGGTGGTGGSPSSSNSGSQRSP
jgi:hypothetical protein